MVQLTSLFVALLGLIEKKRVSSPSSTMLVSVLFRVTSVIGVCSTVTSRVAVLLPSTVVTVIVAVPSLRPVTSPPDDTTAIAVLLLFHVTFWFVGLEGVNIGVRVSVLLT